MKIVQILFSFFFFSVAASAQTGDIPASFPGGDDAFENYIKKNIYTTADAKAARIKGSVIIKFTINEEGKAESFFVYNDLGYGCGEQAEKLLSEMPVWQPGIINGKKIKSTFTKSFIFSDSTLVATGLNIAERKKPVSNNPVVNQTKATVTAVPRAEIKTTDLYASIQKHLITNFKCPAGIDKKWQGSLFLRFYLTGNGTVNDIQIIEGSDDQVDKTAIAVLTSLPALPPKTISLQPIYTWHEAEIIFKKRKITSVILKP
jgi:Gram-negative bacterial TonB protein C-terminal